MANRCFLYGKEEETCDHILLHCDCTRFVSDLLCSLFGVLWVLLLLSKRCFSIDMDPLWGRQGLKCGAFVLFLDVMEGKE